MKHFTQLFFLLFFIPCSFLNAQCDFPFAPANVFDEDVPLFCDGIDGFCSLLPEMYTQQELQGCEFPDFVIDNAQIISFIAGSEFILIRIIPENCSFTDIGGGMQAAIYEEGNPFFDVNPPLVVDCGLGLDEIIDLGATNYKIGNLYYLVLDGWGGSICDYQIEVLEGSTIAPNLVDSPVVITPDFICEGDNYQFIVSADSTCKFIWEVNGGIVEDFFGSTISVFIDNVETFEISVSSTNICYTSEPTVLSGFTTEYTETDSLVNDVFCSGTEYEFFSMTYTEGGIYSFTDTIQCDIFNLELNLMEITGSDTTITEELCAGNCIIYDGDEICEDGMFVFTYAGANGCDSIVNLNILILEAPVGLEIVEICSGDTYLWNGEEYNAPGTYETIISLSDGCDSIAQLQLEVNPPLMSSETAAICIGETILWNGEIYDSPGQYEAEFTTADGCDSIAILNLEVIITEMGFESATACEGEVYVWNEIEFDESGSYSAILSSSQGCDSVVVLELTFFEIDSLYLEVSICEGDIYFFDGEEYNEDVIVENRYTNQHGCDSIRILDLSVIPNPILLIDTMICELDTFFYEGNFYTEEGTYELILPSADDCDTIVTIELGLIDTSYSESTIGVEVGQEFNGIIITMDTTFTEVYTSANGCDSTVVTTIEIVTNTEEIEYQFDFSLYPNPSSDYITIFFESIPSSTVSLKVVNIQGQLMQSAELQNANKFILDASTYASGTYFVIMEQANTVNVKKLIKL